MIIYASIFSKFNKDNNGKVERAQIMDRFVGYDAWVRVKLFQNSPAFTMVNPFGFDGVVWVKFNKSIDNYYIFNVVKNKNFDEYGNYQINVTPEQYNDIITKEYKLNKIFFTLEEPVESLTTGELFNIVQSYEELPAGDNNWEPEDEDEDWDDEGGIELNENGWPTYNEWMDIDNDYLHESFWDEYLRGPESEVQDELQIFCEPSTQGGIGGMFIFDESGNNRFAEIEIDYGDWCATEIELAGESNSAQEYKQKFRDWMLDLINNAEPYSEE